MADASYVLPWPLPYVLERERANAIAVPVRDTAGDEVTPSAGELTLFDESGVAIQGPASCTVGPGVASGTILAATLPATLPLGDRYRIRWTLTLAGVVREFDIPATVARRALYQVVTESTLTSRHQEIADLLAAGEDLSTKITEAWYSIQARLISMGRRPELVMDPFALREVHTFLALHLCFLDGDASVGGDGKYARMAEDYAEKYESAWERLTFHYDSDEDGVSDEDPVGAVTAVFIGGPGDWYL